MIEAHRYQKGGRLAALFGFRTHPCRHGPDLIRASIPRPLSRRLPLRLPPPCMQDRLGVAVRLLAPLEDEVAMPPGRRRCRRSSAPSGGRAGSPAFWPSTTAAMRFSVSVTCSLVTMPWCSQLAMCWLEIRERRAVLHQADIVDVGHLRAADALVDPAHDVAENPLGVVVELLLDVLAAASSAARRQGSPGCRRSRRACATSARPAAP